MALFAAEVARIQEARMAVGAAELADEVLWIGQGAVCYSGSTDWLNKGFGIGLAGAVTSEEMERLVDFYEERGVPAQVELCPYAHPSYVQGLSRHGFGIDLFEQVFARALPEGEDLRAAHPHDGPHDVEIVRVDRDDDAAVDRFIDVSSSGFRNDKPLQDDEHRVLRKLVRDPRTHAFLAKVDGEPVGGGTVDVRGEGASLFGTSVLPAFRRRGIQGALVLARLAHARSLGARFACIESRPGVATERNAARLGFEVVYTKILLTRPVSAERS